MAHLVKQQIVYYVGPDGKRCHKETPDAVKTTTESSKWYGAGVPGHPPKKRIPLARNKRAAEAMLRELCDQAELRAAGVVTSETDGAQKPLADHLDDFEAHLTAKGATTKQVRLKMGRLRRVMAACGFAWLGELDAGQVEQHLASLRQVGRELPPLPDLQWFTKRQLADALLVEPSAIPPAVRRAGLAAEGQGKARRFPRSTAEVLRDRSLRGSGPATHNHYVAALRSFGRWLTRPPARLAANPFAGLERLAEEVDVRRARRSLSQDELSRLFAAAAAGADFRGLTGADRRMLYLVACGTGFREAELASLLPEWFDLGEMPIVQLPARKGKNRRSIRQPLALNLAAELRSYLAVRPPGQPVWPGTWPARAADMLRVDLAAAGIPFVVDSADGPLYADFHALRHSYVAALEAAGVSLKTAMALARHSDPKLTLKRYGKAQAHELAAAVQRLPNIGAPAEPSPLASLSRAEIEFFAMTAVVAILAAVVHFEKSAENCTAPAKAAALTAEKAVGAADHPSVPSALPFTPPLATVLRPEPNDLEQTGT